MGEVFAVLGVLLAAFVAGAGLGWGFGRREVAYLRDLIREYSERERSGGGRTAGELGAAIDAIAIEVERMGEGQRFMTKLLAERPSQGALQPPSSKPPES